MTELVVASSADLGGALLAASRALLYDVFGDELTEDDWQHCLGGTHAVAVDHAGDLRRLAGEWPNAFRPLGVVEKWANEIMHRQNQLALLYPPTVKFNSAMQHVWRSHWSAGRIGLITALNGERRQGH